MRFTLTIDCSNAAFAPDNTNPSEDEREEARAIQLATILERAARMLQREPHRTQWPLFDSNGNRCGQWKLEA